MKYKVLAAALFVNLLTGVASASIIDIGSQQNTFTGNTRGFWFTAPTDFTIVGLGLPTDASTDAFDVSVLRLNVLPPSFPGETSNFDTLFLSRNNVGSALIDTNIDIFSGDIIGILGSRGTNSTNSYGTNSYLSNILGVNVTLERFLMQGDLRSSDPVNIGVSTEGGNNPIGRVLVDIEQSTTVPEPASLVLFAIGLAGFGFSRKKAA